MRLFAVLAVVIATLPADAQDLPPEEAATLPRLIDSLCIDLHDLNGCEQAILLESVTEPDTADLIILSDRRGEDGAQVLLIHRDAAFNGAMWGMSPSLDADETGTLRLHSEQSGIGRHPWFRTLTIGWHESDFRVLRFEQSTYDRFSSSSFACTVDYLSGDWRAEVAWMDPETEAESHDARQGSDATGPRRLAEMPAFAAVPAPCRALEEIYFRNLP